MSTSLQCSGETPPEPKLTVAERPVNPITMSVGVIAPTECEYTVSDINTDSNLDILDVVLMVNIIFGGPEL